MVPIGLGTGQRPHQFCTPLEGEAGISQRVQAYQARRGWIDAGFRFLLQSLDIRNATDRDDLVHAVQATGWSGGVLCLDTLNRAAPGMDENDSKDMGEAIAAAKAIQAALGGLVLLSTTLARTRPRACEGIRRCMPLWILPSRLPATATAESGRSPRARTVQTAMRTRSGLRW